MKIICAKDYSDLSRKAANIISAQVILKPESVLGLATGSSPLGVYRQLILWYEKGDLDFAEATSVNLDEYRGLSANNTQSYHYFMHQYCSRPYPYSRWHGCGSGCGVPPVRPSDCGFGRYRPAASGDWP